MEEESCCLDVGRLAENCYICGNIKTIVHMKDTNEYSTIYQLGKRNLRVHKDECHYSVLLEEGETYTEVIVPREAMDEAMKFPAAEEITWVGQFKLLFGNYDGFEYFVKFCEDNYVSTKTFFWEK